MTTNINKLPILSMEDEELFPKDKVFDVPQAIASFDIKLFVKLNNISTPLWWSRLIISSRGYLANYIEMDEEKLFLTDDAFILLHKVFVEKNHIFTSLEFIKALLHLFRIPRVSDGFCYTLQDDLEDKVLNDDKIDEESSLEKYNIKKDGITVSPCEILFGNNGVLSIRMAEIQKEGYLMFMKILSILTLRFKENMEQGKKKGIRFDIDNEWQPDDRVVLFQQFYSGNRTWILTDFDRHIMLYWKPKGANVIFGDAYIDKKKRSGFMLCEYCGMLEQSVNQFPQFRNMKFCTEQCLNKLLDERNITI
uniref:FLZ-type domain-containing protein n=1 Tax=Strongyloides venezuelensis TaxID=75913 RepID=A0A0K0FXD2_STRVS